MEKILENYKREQLEILKLRFPEKSEQELGDFIESQIKENVKAPKVRFENNYTGKKSATDLLKWTEWYFKKEPITTEHGVMFKKQDQALNLPAKLLEHILNSRKVNKKKMFQAQEEGDKELAKYYNTRQKVDKIFANSWYGVSGQSSSFLYNLFVALSITGKGQSIISTAMTTFERFLQNNILFSNVDQCLAFIKTVVEENKIFNDDEVLDKDKTVEEVTDYLLGQFESKREAKKYENIIHSVLDNIDQTCLNRVYYKNNLHEFMDNEKVFVLLEGIITGCEEFKNPERVPEEIKDQMEALWELTKEYVFYNYGVFNRIGILKTIKRKAVITVDTDSNFLNLEPFFKFVQKKSSLEIDDHDDQMTFKIISIMAYMLGNVIAEAYWKYTGDCNVPESHRPIIAMKNEFLMKRVLLTSRKKNYASVLMLQEGVEVKGDDQLDIKGLSIKKSNVNRNTGKYLQEILEKDILAAPEIDTSKVLGKLEAFEIEVRNAFEKGEIKYMTPAKSKEIEDYKAPFTQASLRASLAWNAVYPNNPIVFPANVNMVKMKAESLDKITHLYETHKEVYQALKEGVFDDEDLGKYGLTYFAMPKTMDKIPDWAIPLVDTETIIRDNLSNFLSILNSIGIKTININADEMFFSNIVDF